MSTNIVAGSRPLSMASFKNWVSFNIACSVEYEDLNPN